MSGITITSSNPSPLTAKLLLWQERRRNDPNITPEELCQDAPHLLSAMKVRVEAMLFLENLLGNEVTVTATPVSDKGPSEDQATEDFLPQSYDRTTGDFVPQGTLSTIAKDAKPRELPPGYQAISELGRGGQWRRSGSETLPRERLSHQLM